MRWFVSRTDSAVKKLFLGIYSTYFRDWVQTRGFTIQRRLVIEVISHMQAIFYPAVVDVMN